ncbi:protocadherin-9 [Clonorchis sinensis]|uniref:Protocadherin-9 n=1 Tax=Clonorchis sinensis TaxID=79923 RepID=H2KRD8_CLOSI|nr:protocadherin-9 [Clonorchis sinensis]
MSLSGSNKPDSISRWIRIFTLQFLLVRMHAQLTMEFTVVEESSSQTFIGNLNTASSLLNNVVDSQSLVGGTFQLLTQTNLFYLNSSTGELFTRSVIDRERICPEANNVRFVQSDSSSRTKLQSERTHDLPVVLDKLGDSICVIQLQVLHFMHPQQAPADVQSHRVLILKLTVLDINDNPPSWQENVIHLAVPEHSPVGTRFPLPTAFDPDCGPINTTVSYALTDATSDGRSSGIKQVTHYGHGAFQLDTELVQESGFSELSSLMWSQQTMHCTRRMFRLWLRVTRDFDYEDVSTSSRLGEREFSTTSLPLKQLHLQLSASDGGLPVALTGTTLINISVVDINDHSPTFKIQNPEKLSAASGTILEDIVEVEENTPVGRVIYVAQASDLDESDKGRLQFSMGTSVSRSVRSAFEVNTNTGEVALLQSPDYEKQKSFTVPLIVTDHKHTATMNLLVRIKNQNDHPPVIVVQSVGNPASTNVDPNYKNTQASIPYSPTRSVNLHITEHDSPGRFIATVFVSDLDEPDGTEAAYDNSLHITPYQTAAAPPASVLSSKFFEASSAAENGIRCQINHLGLALSPLFDGAVNQFKLVTRTSFDREQQAEHFATLVCYDRGHPQLSSQLGIHLLIDDINDHAPIFKNHNMVAYLKENEPAGTVVYTAEATDLDLGINAQLHFSLSSDNLNEFSIDPMSGIIRSLRAFDREQENQFNVTVIVQDRVLFDKNKSDAPTNRGIIQIRGIFPSSMERHSVKANLIVHIQDVNDCPPVFGNSLYQLSVSEDAKINSLVGQIKANDSDATETNNQVQYLIKSQTENDGAQEFRVSAKGHIYVARGNLDRERVPSYNFYLVAVDSGVPALSSTTQVHVYVTDVNDNAPTWVFPAHNNQAVNVTVTEPVGYCVTQLNAIDPDEGENGEVSYRLIQTSRVATLENLERGSPLTSKMAFIPNRHSNADAKYVGRLGADRPTAGNLFELDSNSGSIYVGRSMSTDDIGSIKLVVEASDKGQPVKVNHRVLQINIVRYMSDSATGPEDASYGTGEKSRYRMYSSSSSMGHMEYDLIVIVIMVAVTLIISLALIIAILFLRCGICSTRGMVHYNAAIPADYRHDSGHTHHLEEVFRDSGNVEINGLLPSGMEQFSHGNPFSDTSLNSFQPATENEPMCRSYLSTPGAEPWVVTTLSPKKSGGGQQSVEFIKFNRLGGSIARVQSPVLEKFAAGKRGSVVGSTICSKHCNESTYRSPSESNSPNHDLRLFLAKRPIVRTNPIACSTFRASCSHLTQVRPNTPCKFATGKSCEDIDSMDSGHGRSSTTDNGVAPSNESKTIKGEPHPSSMTEHTDPDIGLLAIPTLLSPRSKSSTLPSNCNLEKIVKDDASDSALDIPDRSPVSTSQGQSQLQKARQSVTWKEPDYQTCNQDDQHKRTVGCLVGNRRPSGCHANLPGEMDESSEGNLVLFSPVDTSGYAQLVRPSLPSLSEQGSPKHSLYSAFPTSFV